MAVSLFDGTSMESQWQLFRMQLINWGTFDGVAEAYFANDFNEAAVTVVSGASGTGKSTLQDAYDEIMMRAPRFNAASNVGGRGVGAGFGSGKRTLHTYARGMLDSVYDEASQTEVARVLRDDSCARWTAIGATFVDGLNNYFTAAKLYYLVPGCDKVDAGNTWFVTANEMLDLSVLESIAERKFDKRALGKALPRARQHASRSEFLNCVYKSLDIGDEDAGQALMELLARIRSGKDFKTVSALFNTLVLELPKTYQCADTAIEEFDNHSKVHEQMLQTLEQRRILEPIVERKHSFDEAQATCILCDAVGSAKDPASSLSFWLAKRRLHVITEVRACVESDIASSKDKLNSARLQAQEAEVLIKQLAAQIEEAGGSRARTLEGRIEATKRECETRRAAFERLSAHALEGGIKVPEDAESYEKLQIASQKYLTDYKEQERQIGEERDKLAVEESKVKEETATLRSDLEYYQNHHGNIPRELSEARDKMAQAAGMRACELPFAGELMEVADGEERWRDAIEICLHGLSRTVLVDREQYDELSCAIDPVRLNVRVNFRGVDLSNKTFAQGQTGGVASKLCLDDKSLFAPWLSRTLADENHDALCVESPSDLYGDGLRITEAGQMRRKYRGSHGRSRADRNVIGFTNEATIARLIERLAQLNNDNERIIQQKQVLESKRSEALLRQRASELLVETPFESIDVIGVRKELASLEQDLQEFLSGNVQLARLREELGQAEQCKMECVKRVGAQEDALGRHEEELRILQSEADSLALPAELVISDEHLHHIESIAVKKASAYHSARDLHASFAQFVQAVDEENKQMGLKAAKTAEADKKVIESALAQFQSRWYDPNRGTTIESYADYAAILAEIEHQGIDEQEALWKSKMLGWIREDLVPLRRSFDLAVQEMQDRIEPINAILSDLPFGADGGRLRISLRTRESKRVSEFRSMLGDLAGAATAQDIDMVSFYDKIKGFMEQIRPGSVDRDIFLDRRRHVEISAKASWPAELEREDSYYNSLAGKSGGEVQELVAFILGSALLYCLGGEAGSKPAFAPVMLDEGFIKADSKFTARAVSAWKSFGFQLIVATPEDKFQSIAPYASACVYMTKNAGGVSRVSQAKLDDRDSHA